MKHIHLLQEYLLLDLENLNINEENECINLMNTMKQEI